MTKFDHKNSHNKVLIQCSRGMTVQYRRLLMDLCQLIPNNKRESKLDTRKDRGLINEVAELAGCSFAVFFEVRKNKNLYLWISKCPEGPSVKLHAQNIHTMDELKFTGNHIKGSRPVLSFQKIFDQQPHLQL